MNLLYFLLIKLFYVIKVIFRLTLDIKAFIYYRLEMK